ncbi:AAA family ATPase [Streptomyces sp. NBC_00490]|uniref:AAA family ATPase n=1 Tax=Streptomyces sp. NBC_00490 TaxID=2903657 RepID=UPI002E16FE73
MLGLHSGQPPRSAADRRALVERIRQVPFNPNITMAELIALSRRRDVHAAAEHATVRSHRHARRGQDIDPAVAGRARQRGGRDPVIARAQAQVEDEPWTRASFDEVVNLQKQRQLGAPATGSAQVFDRSPLCTHALANYLGRPVPRALTAEIERITSDEIYERQVLFVRNLGFGQPTTARRISFQESLVFEKIHEQSYRVFGFELIDIPAGDLAARVTAGSSLISRPDS